MYECVTGRKPHGSSGEANMAEEEEEEDAPVVLLSHKVFLLYNHESDI